MADKVTRAPIQRIERLLFPIVILIGAVMLVKGPIGEAEGRAFPVMGPLTLHDNPVSEPPPSYRHAWSANADKLRECQFERVEWFLGPRHGRKIQVPAIFADPPEVRGEGHHTWTPLLISLDPGAVLENSHADVLHQCPGRPWLTRTRFYN